MKSKAMALAVALASVALVSGCYSDTHGPHDDGHHHDAAAAPLPAGQLTTPPPPPAGPACGELPDLSNAKLGDAIERIPALSTLTVVLQKVDAVGSLDSTANVTFFAPTDEAFAKLPQSRRDELLAGGAEAGEFVSLHTTGPRANTDTLTNAGLMDFRLNRIAVTRTGEDLTVGGTARIVCGNVVTATATIHLVGTVLGG